MVLMFTTKFTVRIAQALGLRHGHVVAWERRIAIRARGTVADQRQAYQAWLASPRVD